MSKAMIISVFVLMFVVALYVAYNVATKPNESLVNDLPDIDVTVAPLQTDATGDSIPDLDKGKRIVIFTPLAKYHIAGVLVGKHYYRGKFMNRLSPCDFALVWGLVPEQLKYLKFRQMIRYCTFTYKRNAPINVDYVSDHMSNNHLIPANTNIRRALRYAKKGMEVELDGYLVKLRVNQGSQVFATWESSLERTDSGGGACELIYLTRLRIEDKVYE